MPLTPDNGRQIPPVAGPWHSPGKSTRWAVITIGSNDLAVGEDHLLGPSCQRYYWQTGRWGSIAFGSSPKSGKTLIWNSRCLAEVSNCGKDIKEKSEDEPKRRLNVKLWPLAISSHGGKETPTDNTHVASTCRRGPSILGLWQDAATIHWAVHCKLFCAIRFKQGKKTFQKSNKSIYQKTQHLQMMDQSQVNRCTLSKNMQKTSENKFMSG